MPSAVQPAWGGCPVCGPRTVHLSPGLLLHGKVTALEHAFQCPPWQDGRHGRSHHNLLQATSRMGSGASGSTITWRTTCTCTPFATFIAIRDLKSKLESWSLGGEQYDLDIRCTAVTASVLDFCCCSQLWHALNWERHIYTHKGTAFSTSAFFSKITSWEETGTLYPALLHYAFCCLQPFPLLRSAATGHHSPFTRIKVVRESRLWALLKIKFISLKEWISLDKTKTYFRDHTVIKKNPKNF